MKIKTFRFNAPAKPSEEQARLNSTSASRMDPNINLSTNIFDEKFYIEDEIVNKFIADKDVIDIKINSYLSTSLVSPEVKSEIKEPKRDIGSRMVSHRAIREITIIYR